MKEEEIGFKAIVYIYKKKVKQKKPPQTFKSTCQGGRWEWGTCWWEVKNRGGRGQERTWELGWRDTDTGGGTGVGIWQD